MTTLTGVFAVLVAGACSLSSNRKIIVISIANSALMATVQGKICKFLYHMDHLNGVMYEQVKKLQGYS